MLSLLAVTFPISRTSEMVQREGLNLVCRCGVYHMGVAFAEISFTLSMFERRNVCIGPLDELGHWFQQYRIRCIPQCI